MSAISIRQAHHDEPESHISQDATRILELCNTGTTLDLYSDRLTSNGYQVVSAYNYDEALNMAHEQRPALILVYDDPSTNIDAVRWLELQHSDRMPQLAMTPLLILADAARVPTLRIQELPDRVVVILRRADTLNNLSRTVKYLLNLWQLE